MKTDAELSGSLSEFLRSYKPPVVEPERDLLDKRFRIDLTTRLPEYDTKTARAYAAASDINSTRQLFALVCEPKTIQRTRVIAQLRGVQHPNLLTLIAAGNVRLSQPNEDRFALIYERPAGKKLSEILAGTTGKINELTLKRNIITPLASTLERFSELGITHGAIRPDNIYFSDVAVLGDCVSEACGASQPFYFEPIERMQSQVGGKKETDIAADYYALGVLVLTLLFGTRHFDNLSPALLLQSMFKDGVFNALTRGKEMPEAFYDFFRGLLTTKPTDRWGNDQLKPWLDGKRYNSLSPPAPSEAIRAFEFMGTQALTRRHLAHNLASYWEKITEPLASGQLHHWAVSSLRNKELSDRIERTARNVAELASKNPIQTDEQLMRLLIVLDPDGPVRVNTLSFQPESIDAFFSDRFFANADKDLQWLGKFIEFDTFSFWLDQQRETNPNYQLNPTTAGLMTKLEKLGICIRQTGLGFGLERVLYDFNPDLPCQSPLCTGRRITTLPALMQLLDQLAASLPKDQDALDRHIAGFITSKMAIPHEIKLHEFSGIPALANHRGLFALRLLSLAQQRTGQPLPGLTHWLALRILPALDYIKSKTLRGHIKSLLVEYAKSGDMAKLSNLVLSNSYVVADSESYDKAWRQYKYNAGKIISYRKGESIEDYTARVGGLLSQVLAYTALLITIFGVLGSG